MTDFTGKLIANTYKDILTINSSATNNGIDNTLRRVQDGKGTNSSLKLSETSAAFTGNVSVNGNLTINGAFQPQNIHTSAIRATTVSATNITTDTLTANNLTFQDVSVSSLRTGNLYAATISAGTISATNINGTNITVDGDRVITSAVAVSVQAIFAAEIRATIANTSAALQQQINIVSTGLSATNTQTQINATQINTLSTSITANASAIAVNSAAITSINSFIAGGAFASAATSATLETRIATVSSTMATSINNSNTAITNLSATLESRIASVSSTMAASIASTSATLESHINTVSATLSIANVSIAANSSAIAVLQALTYASAGTSATLETRIAAVSSTMATSIANSNANIAAVSVLTKTNLDAIASVNSIAVAAASAGTSASLETRIAAVSATMATSIANSNSAITALSATMATSIANHLPLTGGTLTGALTLNADPTADLNAATKQYVDNLTASGIHFHESVRVENPGALTVTYDNGTAGVGATLTNAGAQAALVIDGITMVVDDRVLIYEQADATQNGVYVVTDIGSGSTNWVLTRSSDADTSGNQDDSSLDEGSYFFVEEGNTGAGESYVCSTVGTITFGTTEINFVQFSSSITYTAGTGININTSRVISTSGVPTDAELAAVSATMATSIANSNSAIAALSATMATSINNSNTNITTNAAAITSINGILGDGSAYASAGTSAALQTKINEVSATMATSIANSNAAITSVNTRINSVSVLTKTNKDAITSINAIAYASAGTSATLQSNINAVSATMATSINNSNTAIATLSATMATSISNHLPLAGGTVTGTITASAVVAPTPINTQTGTTYTTSIGDASRLVTLNNGSAITVTIPPNSSVAYNVGTKIDFAQIGAGQVTFVGGAGVSIGATPTLKLRDQHSASTCIKIATDTWLLVGDLAES
jgi:hypothetical protein